MYRWMHMNLQKEDPNMVDARIGLSHAPTECYYGGGSLSIPGHRDLCSLLTKPSLLAEKPARGAEACWPEYYGAALQYSDLDDTRTFDLLLNGHTEAIYEPMVYRSSAFLSARATRWDHGKTHRNWHFDPDTDFFIVTVKPQQDGHTVIYFKEFRIDASIDVAKLVRCFSITTEDPPVYEKIELSLGHEECRPDMDADGVPDCLYDDMPYCFGSYGVPEDCPFECKLGRTCDVGELSFNCNDNCPYRYNPFQEGECTYDLDGDFIANAVDNCPTVYNPNQADCDNDGKGVACDSDDAREPCAAIEEAETLCEYEKRDGRLYYRCGEDGKFRHRNFFPEGDQEKRLVRVSQCQCDVRGSIVDCSEDFCRQTGFDEDEQWGRIFWTGKYFFKHQKLWIRIPCPDDDKDGLCDDLRSGAESPERRVTWHWWKRPEVDRDDEDQFYVRNNVKRYPFVVRTKPAVVPDPQSIAEYCMHRGHEPDDPVEIEVYEGFLRESPGTGGVAVYVDASRDQDVIVEAFGRIGLRGDLPFPPPAIIEQHLDYHDDRLDIVDVYDADDYIGNTRPIDASFFGATLFDHPGSSPVMYLFGGELQDGTPTDRLLVREEDAVGWWRWRDVGRAPGSTWPSARSGAALVYDQLHDRLLCFGGRTARGVSGELWAFDIAGQEWLEVEAGGEPMPALAYYSSVVDGDSWYIYGGLGRWGNESVLGVWSFSDQSFTVLSDGADGPSPRRGASLALDKTNGRLLLFGGDAAAKGVLGAGVEGDRTLERELTPWFQSGEGMADSQGDAVFLEAYEDESAWYYSGAPYMRSAGLLEMDVRMRVEEYVSFGEYSGTLFGAVLDREIPLAFIERGGSRYVALVGDLQALFQSGQADASWPLHEVDWSEYHEYRLLVDRDADTVTLTVDGVQALEHAYSSLSEAGVLALEDGEFPEHFGSVGVGTGVLLGNDQASAAGRAWVDHFRWRWEGEGELLNDAWYFDLATGTWNIVLTACVIGTSGCPLPIVNSAARYYNPVPGRLVLVGGTGPEGYPVPEVRSLDPDDPEAGFEEHLFPGSVPRDQGDCDADGLIDPEFGRLCTAEEHWWDPVGSVLCGEDDEQACSAGPAEAEVLGRLRLPFKVNAFDVAGDRLVAATVVGLAVVDVSDPRHPGVERFVPLGPTYDVKVRGGHAFVGHLFGLGVIDIGSGEIAGWSFVDMQVKGVALLGDRAYVAGKKRFGVVDISTPSDPVVLLRKPGLKHGHAVELFGLRPVVTDNRGVHVYRMEVDGSAEQVGFAETHRALVSMHVAGNGAYAVDRRGRAVYVDLREPSSPVVSGSHAMSNFARGRIDADGLHYGLKRRRIIEIVEVAP